MTWKDFTWQRYHPKKNMDDLNKTWMDTKLQNDGEYIRKKYTHAQKTDLNHVFQFGSNKLMNLEKLMLT